jgi:hypothetical protein
MAQGGPLSKMKYMTPEAFRAGLEARARKLRDESGEGLDMIRRKLAFEAFLCRVTPSGVPLVLKGGYLMHLRYQVGARPTKDLDTALQESQLETQSPKDIERRMREALQLVAASSADDFFSFEIGESMADLGMGREFTGYRFNVTARVGSRIFDSFHIDCTTGDALIDPFDMLTIGDGLAFAGIPTAKVQAIREGQHFAEKLHALCRPRTKQNSRVKDLFDLLLFIKQGVEPAAVAKALHTVFEVGGNLSIPKTLPVPPREWRDQYEEMARENHLEYSFDDACQRLAQFYDEIVRVSGNR